MTPALLLLALGCLTHLTPGDSEAPDTADTAAQAVVLLDEDAFLPGPDGHGDYVDFYIDFSGPSTWVHIQIASETATTLNGILNSPSEGCSLQVPYYGSWMEEHENQGWIQLHEPGRHILAVFGDAPRGGATVHCLVETVPAEADLPFQDAELACTLDDAACVCSGQCSCSEISG